MRDTPKLRERIAADATAAARTRIEACEEAERAADWSENPADWPPSPASAPYCGCETCIVRETLDAAWGVLEEGVRDIYRHDVRAPFWRGFIVGCLWAWLWLAIGFTIGFTVGWVT